MTKREKQKQEAIQSCKERYSYNLAEIEYEFLCKEIKNNNAIFIERQSNRVSKQLIKLNEELFLVMYDRIRNSIFSFITSSNNDIVNILKDFINHKIISVSKNYASKILTTPILSNSISGIISIGDENTSCPSGFEEIKVPKLRVTFHDCTYTSNYQIAPNIDNIQEIIRFGKSLLANTKSNQYILVHCQAGMSRSTATAHILRCMMLGKGNELKAAKALRLENKMALPNILMLKYADTILDTNGEIENSIIKTDDMF